MIAVTNWTIHSHSTPMIQQNTNTMSFHAINVDVEASQSLMCHPPTIIVMDIIPSSFVITNKLPHLITSSIIICSDELELLVTYHQSRVTTPAMSPLIVSYSTTMTRIAQVQCRFMPLVGRGSIATAMVMDTIPSSFVIPSGDDVLLIL